MTKIQRRRLENVIVALQDAERANAFFCMAKFGLTADEARERKLLVDPNVCATPACAFGHYAVRHDLQRSFRLEHSRYNEVWPFTFAREYMGNGFKDPHVLSHFGITVEESRDLFGCLGCGDAKTPAEAIAYIRRFIDTRL